MFAEQRCYELVQDGHLSQVIKKDAHPSAPLADEPHCTRSQYVEYRDRWGNVVAGVHQYLRPDNTLGASGQPDPKELTIGDTQYLLALEDR